jgi:branched-chain amino acid transport system permease protein
LWAHYITYISPNDFTLTTTILILLAVVLGGRGTLMGPLLGAFLVIFFQEALRFLPLPANFTRLTAPIQGMVFGLALVIMMLRRPEGLIAEHKD